MFFHTQKNELVARPDDQVVDGELSHRLEALGDDGLLDTALS